MERRLYKTGEFARRVSVSERTLRYYDRVGLLSPSSYSESGYRQYSDTDMVRLQHILALKFLGFRLDEIQAYLSAGPRDLQDALANQKSMMREKRDQLDAVIQAIEETEKLVKDDCPSWEAVVHVIQALQMQQKNEWRHKYFTPEQCRAMDELTLKSYSVAARQRLASRGTWTEEDQKGVDRQYAHLAAELKRLVAEGADPGSAAAQEAARLQRDLLQQFTQGDPEMTAGLQAWWQNLAALPREERPLQSPYSEEEQVFLQKATVILKQSNQGE